MGKEEPETRWYEDAVFYELHVKSYFDSNDDGIGDFNGLTQKLDHLQDLGVSCVWLLPFFPSPLLDDGYDVADYRDVHPSYGTIQDFQTFLNEAHRRNIRVAAEMVINHTSDQHPWFQAARSAPSGSPLRDFYYWRDRADGFCNVADNKRHWAWDNIAGAFYWHRFFPHQPDLNYDHPQVREEMLKVLRFWLDLGVDGLCLNGASFLIEREGTDCEHLPETHSILKEMRRELQGAYPQAMLQAGVNAWPGEVRSYFGDGDECHMAPNLALAQRLFLAVRQEDRHPLTDLLRQTPALPPHCQWITLLRNHDELTLALATDEERDYMYREYAGDPRMRLHGGIRRRLAPLVENNRRRIELLFGLLFSLPGAPVLYYGDEIGMGDNVFLGGRNGVRTPMQWSSDRNAGFSRSDFAHLYAPPIMDPLFGYQAVNVEAERRDTSSLLHWIRQLIALRRRMPTLSRGELQFLEPSNRKVIAFLRRRGEETVLVVANLARSAQPVELDLSRFAGLIPQEVLGRAAFPRIGSSPYLITLAPHGFHWFELRKTVEDVAARFAPVRTEDVQALPVIELADGLANLLEGSANGQFESQVLPAYLRSQRWFGGKARRVERITIADWGAMPIEGVTAFWTFLEVHFEGGSRDRYLLPLAVSTGSEAARIEQTMRPLALARVKSSQSDALLHDALALDSVCSLLLASVGRGESFITRNGVIKAVGTSAFGRLRGDPDYPLLVVRGPATSSNSILFFGRRLLMKLFRRLEPGINPDFEISRFLTEERPFERIPSVAGTFEYRPKDEQPFNLAILQALVPNQGDGWQHAIEELRRYFDRASARMYGPDPVPPDGRPLLQLADAVPPPAALETIGSYLQAARSLGRRTAQMHLALADTNDPAFVPESLTEQDMVHLRDEIQTQANRALTTLKDNFPNLPEEVTTSANKLLELGGPFVRQLAQDRPTVPSAMKTRVHGDYHLGQVLWVDNDYILLDFEGEPTRTVEERRAKFSPVRDVAGMLRSYHYAAYAGLFAFTQNRPDDFARLAPWADLWQQWTSAAFLRAYLDEAGEAAFLPRDRTELETLLNQFTLAKAFYELVYELNNRPQWVRIPLSGILALLEFSAQEPEARKKAP